MPCLLFSFYFIKVNILNFRSCILKSYTFIMSHSGSNHEFLTKVFNYHPKIASICTNTIYTQPNDINNLYSILVKNQKSNEYKPIMCDTILHNHAISSKSFLTNHKCIYLVRKPEPTLSELIARKEYNLQEACNYYCFRLQRLSQFAKITGGIFLTWEDLANQNGFRLIENYLDLRMILNSREEQLKREYQDTVPESLIKIAERAYEKYINKIKKYTKHKVGR